MFESHRGMRGSSGYGFGFRISGFGFRISGFGFRVYRPAAWHGTYPRAHPINTPHRSDHKGLKTERHGQFRHPNPDKMLIDTAVAKAQGNECRPDYLRNHNKAFLPLVMSTSGRLHSEFVRLLYILAHRRAVRFFATLDYEPCDEELCQRQRRGAFSFQHRARIGLSGAQATALRMGGHTRPPAGVGQQPLQCFDAQLHV
jgi:hypothetical protein